jgi:ATP-dependent helicase/DNAse subunit B
MALHALKQLLVDIKRLGGLLGTMGRDLALPGFLRLLKAALDGYRRNLKPAVPGGVALVGADDTIGLSYHSVFVTGLNDGSFPPRPARDWLWSDSLVRRLQAAGFHVEGREVVRSRNRAAFACAVGAARERLYLSFSEADALGSTNLASPFVTEVLQRLVDGTVDIQRVPLTDMRRTALEAAVDLTRLVEVETKRLSGEVGSWSGLMATAVVLDGLAAKYDSGFRWSVTRLGEYARCPFRYFAARELGLAAAEELGEELSPLERGSILHAILHDFYSRHRGENLLKRDPAGLKEELREIAKRRLDASSGERLALHPRLWEASRERLVETVTKVLENDLRLAERSFGTLRASHLEWSFGRRFSGDNDPRSTDEPFVLSRPGEELRFAGVVDRVDADDTGRFMVYDYKTGKSLPGFSQMVQGENLQLPLYVLAVKTLLMPDAEAIGGGFYSLAEPAKPFGLYRKELASLVGAERKRSGLIPESEWDGTVWSLVEQLFAQAADIRRGRFGPDPLDGKVCRSCEFKSACRWVAAVEVVTGDE